MKRAFILAVIVAIALIATPASALLNDDHSVNGQQQQGQGQIGINKNDNDLTNLQGQAQGQIGIN